MQATITYYLSEAGRKAALKAGSPANKKQTITGEIDPQTLDLFSVDEYGNISMEVRLGAQPVSWSPGTWDEIHFDKPFETINAAVAARQQIVADREILLKKQAEAQKAKTAAAAEEQKAKIAAMTEAVERFIADPSARSTSQNVLGVWINGDCPSFHQFNAERGRRNAADEAATKTEEARRLEAKRTQIAAWVTANGNENQQERQAAGLFPEEEATNVMMESAFAPVSLALYEKITKGEVRATCSSGCGCAYDTCDVKFETEEATSASETEWEMIRQLQKLLPSATITLQSHAGWCKDHSCNRSAGQGTVTRKGVYVKLQVGAFTFNREYAV